MIHILRIPLFNGKYPVNLNCFDMVTYMLDDLNILEWWSLCKFVHVLDDWRDDTQTRRHNSPSDLNILIACWHSDYLTIFLIVLIFSTIVTTITKNIPNHLYDPIKVVETSHIVNKLNLYTHSDEVTSSFINFYFVRIYYIPGGPIQREYWIQHTVFFTKQN